MKALHNSKALPLRSLSALPRFLLRFRRYGCLSLKSVHAQEPAYIATQPSSGESILPQVFDGGKMA